MRGGPSSCVSPMDLTPLVLIVLVVVFLIVVVRWHYGRSAEILQKWADDNGFQIVAKELRHFFKGPFFFTASKHQTVYRVLSSTRRGGSGRDGSNVAAGGSECGRTTRRSAGMRFRNRNAGIRFRKLPSRRCAIPG